MDDFEGVMKAATKMTERFNKLRQEIFESNGALDRLNKAFAKIDAVNKMRIKPDIKSCTPYKPKIKPLEFKREKPWRLYYRRS